MTVASEVSSIEYAGDGITKVFQIPFGFLSNSDIQVTARDSLGDTAILSTGFSIAGSGSGSGNCTFTVAPSIGTDIIIERVPQLVQPVDWVENENYLAETQEQSADRAIYQIQHLRQLIRRCIQVPSGDPVTGNSAVLSSASARASKIFAFSSAGAPELLTLADVGGTVTALTSSLIAQTLNGLKRTALEVTNGVTPSDYAYPPGELRRYGAAVDGATDDSAAIHQAIASGHVVLFPAGVTMAPNLDDTVISGSLRIQAEKGAVLDGGGTGFFDLLNAGGVIDEVSVTGLEFRNCGFHVIRCFSDEPLDADTSFTTINRFTFVGNYVHDCNSGVYLACKVKKPLVHGNRFYNLTAATSGCYGVHIGGNYLPEESFDDGDVSTSTDRITLTGHVFTNAQKVQLNNVGGGIPGGLALSTDYYLKVINANTIELYSDAGLSSIVDITSASGGGTHYIFDADPDVITDLEDYVVSNNHFDGLDAQTGSTECHAIILYGRNGSIVGNTVKNIVNSGDGNSAEGIYTKMRYVEILGNTLVDAGTGEGYIAIKGNPPVPMAGNKSPVGKAAIVSKNVFVQTDGASDVQTGVYVQVYGASINDNQFDGLGGSCVETQNQWQLNEVDISDNKVRRHRGARAFYVRHYGSNFTCNRNQVAEFVAHSGLSDVAMIDLAGTANQGNWDNWEVSGNRLRDVGTCLATSILRCINVAPNTGNTATGLRIADNVMVNQQGSITEIGLNLSTGTYVNLVVKDNDAQRVDGNNGLTVSGTISSSWFDGNLFTQPFDNSNTDVEWRHVNRIHTNRTAGASARTYVLPAAVPGMEYTFSRAASGTVAVDPDGTEQIHGTTTGGATATLSNQGSCITLRCETAGFWTVVSAFGVTLN